MDTRTALQSIFLSLLGFFGFFAIVCHSQPLSTSGRWIVDAKTGNRVKLHCINWPGHLHAMIPEGLEHQPVDKIATHIASMGFNCVRLTWAIHMYTRPENHNLTAEQSLQSWNLFNETRGLAKHNPHLLKLSIQDVQKAAIDALHAHNVMAVIDNHVSFPMWCCSVNDGNGFFGDKFFDPDEWLQGLHTVAHRYKGHPGVVAMSMRNELRGPRQNVEDWYKYMQEGARVIHEQNPDLLVIVSGFKFDQNLSFVKDRPFQVPLDNKLVYEYHWYSFDDPPEKWEQETNFYCMNVTKFFFDQAGFFFRRKDNPIPLFLSEFGKDTRGVIEKENRYMVCVLAALAEYDIDFALWTLQGSYMLRENKIELDEPYGILTFDWSKPRNLTFVNWIKIATKKLREANATNKDKYHILLHPQTGKCSHIKHTNLVLGDCPNFSRFIQKKKGGPIKVLGRTKCVTAMGVNKPVKLTDDCTGPRSQWSTHSISNHHLAATDEEGNFLCLDYNENTFAVVTRDCLCLSSQGNKLVDHKRCLTNPQHQWFKLVPANVHKVV